MGKYILFALFALQGCAGMFSNRTFLEEMDRPDSAFFSPGEDFQVVPGDSGRTFRTKREIYDRTPASASHSADMREQQMERKEIDMLVNKLSHQEYMQYREAERFLQAPGQMLYYLRLPKQERRPYISSLAGGSMGGSGPSLETTRYFTGAGYVKRNRFKAYSSTSMAQRSSLYLGMTKSDVKSRWRIPDSVEVAGDPGNENEKWTYYESGALRHIYFEKGRVEGWYIE